MSKNRNPVKQLFITYPKSVCDKHTFRDHLLKFEPDYYKIVEEHHKDGTPHLHAVIRFKNKYSKAYILKYFKEVYPDDYKRIDVAPVRSIKNALKYLSKEDTQPLTSGEYTENRNPAQNQRNSVARECGYNTIEAMLASHQKEQEYFARLRPQVFESYMDHLKYELEIPYDVRKLIDKFFAEKHIVKDDMTKLLTYFNIAE